MTFNEKLSGLLSVFKKKSVDAETTTLEAQAVASLKGALKDLGVTKKLVLQISQTGTSAPTYTVIHNSTDLTPGAAAYSSTGIYTIAGISVFADVAKTAVKISNGATLGVVMAESITGDLIQIKSSDLAATPALANAILDNAVLEIEYYAA